jgi:hypothetical protein
MNKVVCKTWFALLAGAMLFACSAGKMNLSEMGTKGIQLGYKPTAGSTAKYKISSSSEFSQSMMGQEQTFGSTSDQLMKLHIASIQNGAINYDISYENVSIESSVPGIPDMDTYKKELLQSNITVQSDAMGKVGKISGVDAIKKTTTGKNIEVAIKNLFLVFPAKAIKIGETWPEEQTNSVVSGPLEIEIKSSTVYRFVGVEKHMNKECYRFDSETKITLSGAGEQGGMGLEYEGSGGGKGVVYFDYLNGLIVSMSGSQSTEGVVAIPSQGMDIPTSSVQNAKIELTE